MIDIQIHKDSPEIATLLLADGKVNAMNIEWCQLLSARLSELESDPSIRAVVLTSGERVFSAGVDLKRVVREEPAYVDPFINALSQCFRDAFVFKKPLVVAINGHAIAGGCIVAACGDWRLTTSRVRIGLPELRLGVPLPTIAVQVISRVASPSALQAMLNTGANYRNESALQVGLADAIVEKDALLETAYERAGELAKIPVATFGIMKQQIRQPFLVQADLAESKFGDSIREIWNSQEIRDAIAEYADRL